jgi:hypothetical protein
MKLRLTAEHERNRGKEGGGVFCCKIRYKLLIHSHLALGYRVHFARFCVTFRSRPIPVRGEMRPLFNALELSLPYYAFQEIILRIGVQGHRPRTRRLR